MAQRLQDKPKRKLTGSSQPFEPVNKKKKDLDFSISSFGSKVVYEWSYDSLKTLELDVWLDFLNSYQANDLFPHQLRIDISKDPKQNHKASFQRCDSKDKDEYNSFWEWKNGSSFDQYRPFSIPFTAYVKKWQSEKFQYVPLQHMVMVEERGFVGNRHNFFDRCRIYLSFVRFLKRTLECPELFPWLMWNYKGDWNTFMETFFSKLWIYFAPSDYIYSSSRNVEQYSPMFVKNEDDRGKTCVQIEPWNVNRWNIDKTFYYGWVDPMEWNHIGVLRFMEMDPNLMDPYDSPKHKPKDPLFTSYKVNDNNATLNSEKRKEEGQKESISQEHFVDDPRNNAPYIFMIPKFSMVPFWPERDFNTLIKLQEKERETLIEKIAKDFGKHIFRLNHCPILLNNDFTTCIKIFQNIDRVVRYCTEPIGYMHVSLSGIDSIESKLEDICDWIHANPHWPEIEWISIKQYKEHVKRGDCIVVDGRDLRQVQKLIEQIECFGSDRFPDLREEKDEVELIANLPCGMMICAGEPQGLKIVIKMQNPILSIRSIFSITTEGLSNTIRTIENFEESIQTYWKKISTFYEKHKKAYVWFSQKIALWSNFISQKTIGGGKSNKKKPFCLPVVSLDRWNSFLRLKDEKEVQSWLESNQHAFFRYENSLKSDRFVGSNWKHLQKWRSKLWIARNPEDFLEKSSSHMYEKSNRYPPWFDCPKMSSKKPMKMISKTPCSIPKSKSLLMSFEAFQKSDGNKNVDQDMTKEEESCILMKWKCLERALLFRKVCCFFPGAFLNHTYQGIPSSSDIWVHVLYPMMFNSMGKIQSRDSEFLPRFEPIDSLRIDSLVSIYQGTYETTKKTEKIWKDWVNSIQENVYFEEWEIDSLNEVEEDQRIIWELCFWLLLVYDHLVYVTPLWKLRQPSAWWYDYIHFSQHRILPIGWKGGDTFVVLIGLMTGKEMKTIQQVMDHPYFQIWKKDADLTKCYQLGIKEHEFTTFYPKERRHQSTLFESRQLLKDNIVLSSSWKDTISVESSLHIISTITRSLKFPEFQIFCDRAMNSIPFRIQSTQNQLDDGEGRGVEQQCITMYWEAIEKLQMFDWFHYLKTKMELLKKAAKLEESNPKKEQVNSEISEISSNPLSSSSSSPFIEKKKLDQMLPKTYSWKANGHHAYVLGFILNYSLLHEIKFHLNQPPMFWKLVSFRPELERIQLQDFNDTDPNFCRNKFYSFFWTKEMMQETLDFKSFQDTEMSSLESIAIDETSIHFYIRKEIEQFISKNVPAIPLNFLRDGFFTTHTDYKPTFRILYNHFFDPWRENLNSEMIIKALKLVSTPSNNGMKHKNCIESDHIIVSTQTMCPATALVKFLRKLDREGLKNFLNFTTSSPLFGCAGDSLIYIMFNESDHDKLPVTRTCGRLLELTINSSRRFSSIAKSYEFYESQFLDALQSDSSFPMM